MCESDWRKMIGRVVTILTGDLAGRAGIILYRAGNWDEPGDRDWYYVKFADGTRRPYHIRDLEFVGTEA